MELPFVGTCGHVFCQDCISKAAKATMDTVARNREMYGNDNENTDYLWQEIDTALEAKEFLDDVYDGHGRLEERHKPIAVPCCPSCRAPGGFFRLFCAQSRTGNA